MEEGRSKEKSETILEEHKEIERTQNGWRNVGQATICILFVCVSNCVYDS